MGLIEEAKTDIFFFCRLWLWFPDRIT